MYNYIIPNHCVPTWYPPDPHQAVQSNQDRLELNEVPERILCHQFHSGSFVSLPLNI